MSVSTKLFTNCSIPIISFTTINTNELVWRRCSLRTILKTFTMIYIWIFWARWTNRSNKKEILIREILYKRCIDIQSKNESISIPLSIKKYILIFMKNYKSCYTKNSSIISSNIVMRSMHYNRHSTFGKNIFSTYNI